MFEFLPKEKRWIILRHPALGRAFFSRQIDKNTFLKNLKAFAPSLCNRSLGPKERFTPQEITDIAYEIKNYPNVYWKLRPSPSYDLFGGRTKLGYALSDRYAFLLEKAAAHLKGKQFDPEKAYYEFLIKRPITPDGIKSLLSLPYEIALTEANRRIVLSTCLVGGGGKEADYIKRRNYSRTSFHTHPQRGLVSVNTPSFADALVSEFASAKTTLGLAHPGGVIIYRAPSFDPDTNSSCENERPRDIIIQYCANRGIRIAFKYPAGKKLKEYSKLSDLKRVQLQRQFVKETRMILDEASWNDKVGLERVLSKIFG